MSADLFERYRADLDSLSGENRLRRLNPRAGIDFVSNDYLALADAPRMKAAVLKAIDSGTPVGAGGSRLLRGNCSEHEALEDAAAKFFGTESALYFSGGFVANYAVLTTLPQRGDLILMDTLVHASVHEGARAARAQSQFFAHNDANAAEQAIREWRAAGNTGRVWIAVESVYSMDGDVAPIADLLAIADRHDGFLYVDEAHATGVFGPQGRGLTAPFEPRDNLLVIHTCGKALGAAGALVTGPRVVRDFLVNRCRPFIFATAPSPLNAVAVMEALAILQDEPERRAQIDHLIASTHRKIAHQNGWRSQRTQIVPYIVGDNALTMQLAGALQARGFDVRGIRPPTVPAGTSRLRISLTLNVTERDVDTLLAAIAEETTRSAA
jgi:8-amino-7-oxononanoate synthase